MSDICAHLRRMRQQIEDEQDQMYKSLLEEIEKEKASFTKSSEALNEIMEDTTETESLLDLFNVSADRIE